MTRDKILRAHGCALLTALLGLSGFVKAASVFEFKVAFADVPGSAHIRAGDLGLGIRILEQQLADGVSLHKGEILATLCAAYIVDHSLAKAGPTCDQAVDVAESETAFNNRGVLRAHLGDLVGARQDFARARPQDYQQHVEDLKAADVGVMAESNHTLINELAARYTPHQVKKSLAANASRASSPIE